MLVWYTWLIYILKKALYIVNEFCNSKSKVLYIFMYSLCQMPRIRNKFRYNCLNRNNYFCQWKCHSAYQWPSCSALNTGRRKMPGSISGHACLFKCSEFSLLYLRNSSKYGLELLRKTLHAGHSSLRLKFHVQTISLNPITPPNPKMSSNWIYNLLLGNLNKLCDKIWRLYAIIYNVFYIQCS